MVKSFRELHVWQKAMGLTDALYTATTGFPRDEMFGLAAQIRRAAVSIPSNVAEGRAVGGGRFMHHIRIALGSEAELQTQIELAMRRAYIPIERGRVLLEQASEVWRMLHGLHDGLKARRTRMRTAGATTLLLVLHVGGFLPF
jgi:four helix bundle protein